MYATIFKERLFVSGERIAIGVSGGKDSTVLAHVLNALNERHNLGLHLLLVCVDEGIEGLFLFKNNCFVRTLAIL